MILLVAVALAGSLPEPPPAPESVAEDCARSIPIVIGRAPAGLLDTTGKATCSGVVVGTAELADLLRIEAWSRAVYDLARIDAAACAAEAVDAAERADYWRGVAERPTPVLQRPGVGLGIGVGIGVIGVLGGALAVRLVAEAPLYAE